MVGCSSRCMCMIRLHRHIGAGALIGPASDCPISRPLADKVDGVVVLDTVSVEIWTK